jgi:hypothetical protein
MAHIPEEAQETEMQMHGYGSPGRFDDSGFQGQTVLQVFCEFGLDELSPD